MKISHSRSASSGGRRDRFGRAGGQEGPGSTRPGQLEVPFRSVAGARSGRGGADSARAVRPIGDGGGAGADAAARQAVLADPGILDELHGLRIGLFDGWLSEDQLRHLAGSAYRARPAVDRRRLASLPDDAELQASGTPGTPSE